MASTVAATPNGARVRATAVPPEVEHELVLVRRGERSGAYMVIAVHSTVLGPALGGCRMWHYPSVQAGIDDALRLSRAMTLKTAVAGLGLGGGKAVICLSAGPAPAGAARERLLRDFADAVQLVGGRYITAEDVGTTSRDMELLARFTPYVVGRPGEDGGSGDPGDFTAAGVQAAMRACCAHLFGAAELAGRSVAVVGLGSVGAHLARRLARVGASLVLSDIDAGKAELARELGAQWLEPQRALRAQVDILAPCALGGVLDDELAGELRCRAICGAANNQLARDEIAERLAARGILYAPDFVVNAAGVINVSLELGGYDPDLARRRAAGIEDVLADVVAHAERSGLTPLAAATELAQARLRAAATAPARAA
jgi:leucine dehydrogenase